MSFRPMIRPLGIALIASILTLSSTVTPVVAGSVSKTPDLSRGFKQPEQIEIVMPDDYPEELYEIPMDTPHYIVVDEATNKILAAKDASQSYAIASISKVPALYMVYQALDEGKLKLDDKVTVPEIIVDEISPHEELSNIGLEKDVKYPVKDLMYAVMMASANDATSALLWHIFGSEQEAVTAVREQLRDWGLDTAEFYSVSGAPNLYLPEEIWMEDSNETSQNRMSAADVALMTKYIIEEYPEILDISSTEHYVFMEDTDQAQDMFTTNQMLAGGEWERPEVNGLKSGFTDEAGKCFVTTSTEANGRETIAVVMGIQDPYNSYEESATLLNHLANSPDLYELEDLPINMKPTHQELLAEEEKEQQLAQEDDTSDQVLSDLPDKRHSGLTNFMRSVFSIFD